VLDVVVGKAVSAHDLRVGLYLLRESGLAAEDENSSKVTLSHVEKGVKKAQDFTIKPEEDLNEETKLILKLIKTQSGRIGDLYKLYQGKGGTATYKTFQRRIDKLDKGGFVNTKKIVGGKKGSTTLISTKNKSLDDY